MRKNKKHALELIRKLKVANELDFKVRMIPMSAVYALLLSGEVMFDGSRYSINECDR